MYLKTGIVVNFDELGPVRFVVRPTSRKVSAKWKDGGVVCNIPPRMTLQDIAPIVKQLAPRLLNSRLKFEFDEQNGFEVDNWKVGFVRNSVRDDKLSATYSTDGCKIMVPRDADFRDEDFTRRVNGLICKIAQNTAPKILIPLAVEVSDKLGVVPDKWMISYGHRTLGFCNRQREIALSYMVVFLPRELKEYIICHELAHLTEMNHSDRFHRLCNQYCSGRENELAKKVKNYRWPVIR
ncbi:MAG: M48 family metallopeptidase [Muribaculaceae bacterium]|nr:M48 family metallopeptidase [Muribaculaceae bacterium]MDE7368397.1 M48 family metallopeptidase [Muribaculaceae bacterium]